MGGAQHESHQGLRRVSRPVQDERHDPPQVTDSLLASGTDMAESESSGSSLDNARVQAMFVRTTHHGPAVALSSTSKCQRLRHKRNGLGRDALKTRQIMPQTTSNRQSPFHLSPAAWSPAPLWPLILTSPAVLARPSGMTWDEGRAFDGYL